MTPVPVILLLEFKAGDVYRYSASPHPQFRIKNKGAGNVNIAKLEIRYWYKYDGVIKPEESYIDWAGVNGNPITDKVNIGIISGSFGTQDRYIKVTFKSNAGYLGNGINDYLEVNTRFNKNDWSQYDQANDWSFINYTSFTAWDRVTVYYDGIKVYGYEPGEIGASYVKATPTPLISFEISDSTVYNYPNPSKGETNIRFPLLKPQEVRIIVTDIKGNNVWQKVLREDEVIRGINKVKWNCKDESGKGVANGVYLIKIIAEGKVIIKKLVVVK